MSRDEAASTLMGQMLDLIACHQIKREGAKLRRVLTDDEIIPDVR